MLRRSGFARRWLAVPEPAKITVRETSERPKGGFHALNNLC